MESQTKMQNAFEILGLTEGASRAEIRHAYAELSKRYHVETDPEAFSTLHEAYKTALAAAGRRNAGMGDNEKHDKSSRSAPSVREDFGTGFARSQAKNDGHSMTSGTKNNVDTASHSSETETDTGTNHSSGTKNAAVHPLPPSETQNTPHSTSSEKASATSATASASPDALLDRLLGVGFSIENCSDLTQLLHYRCRYEEISPEIRAVLLRIPDMEQGISDEAHLHTIPEAALLPPDHRDFLGVPWARWKALNQTCIVCHPDFYRAQHTPSFLNELYRFLSEETLNLRGGIRQELYFALCMAYGFFSSGEESKKPHTENPTLAEIEKLLRLHPKHVEYQKDLDLWPECLTARRIVRLCHEIYADWMPSAHPASGTKKSDVFSEAAKKNADSLSEAAAELLLDDETPWKEFIYDRLTDCPDHSLRAQFTEKRKYFFKLGRLRRKFADAFINLLDNHIEENYIYNAGYLPLATRLDRIKDRYLKGTDQKRIVCRPAFLAAFREWLFPHRNGFSSVPCLMHYDTWKMLRTCFDGSSAIEAEGTRYLTTEYYFPEYEKRYQKELAWENARIEEEYFREAFPVPALSRGKLDLLDTIKNATPAGIADIEKIFGNLTFDPAGLDFLTRITNAMTRFNFLLVTQKREKEAVPGDAFCFLEDEVLLYRKKENLVCRLTHPVFYDLISWKFEAAAFPAFHGKSGYDEDFLNTACRNLYCYRCYVRNLKSGSPAAGQNP